MTRDTVARETPARRATSAMVGDFAGERAIPPPICAVRAGPIMVRPGPRSARLTRTTVSGTGKRFMSRVGIRDVALRAGVSISTVSNALNKPGTVSEALAGRNRAAVAEPGYVPPLGRASGRESGGQYV